MEDPERAERLDRAEARAMVDGDAEVLSRLWSEHLVVTPPGGGSADKATVLRLVRSGAISYREVTRVLDRVEVLDGTIVTSGREHVLRTDGGAEDRRYTHVWQEEREGWRLVVRHASR